MRYLILLTLFLHSTCFASSQQLTFGAWSITDGDGFVLASTWNDSNSSLGIICLENPVNCSPYLVNQLSCQEGSLYPALANTDTGLVAINMECMPIGKTYLFVLPESHINFIVSGNVYSLAFGVDNGKFRAAYFDLSGSAKAYNAIKTMAESSSKPSTTKPTQFKDDYL